MGLPHRRSHAQEVVGYHNSIFLAIFPFVFFLFLSPTPLTESKQAHERENEHKVGRVGWQ